MGKVTGISWCHHTFNLSWGCVKISPGCKFCYAETLSNRFGDDVWGVNKHRKTFGDKHWNEPVKWNEAATKSGIRARTFCGSMCDVFENHEDVNRERIKLWKLIKNTPMLDWQLLTKRPENIIPHIEDAISVFKEDFFINGEKSSNELSLWLEDWLKGNPPDNVWLGTSAENQEYLETRVPELKKVPAKVRFISGEPLIGALDFSKVVKSGHKYIDKGRKMECAYGCGCGMSDYQAWGPEGVDPYEYCPNAPKPFHWVIFGGESHKSSDVARPMELEWVRDGVKQCREYNIAPFVKQMGSHLAKRLKLNHSKGEDPTEWDVDLQVQEFPV
jgi:protein gp37